MIAQYNQFREVIHGPARHFVLIPHVRPDADALGSALGLQRYLSHKGHTSKILSPSEYPDFLSWLPGQEDILVYPHKKERTPEIDAQFRVELQKADYIFCIDFSGLKRMAPLDEFVQEAKKPIAVIDHHQGREDFADFYLWDTKAAATAQLVFRLIDKLGDHESIMDLDLAASLYAGIMTDTGSFKYPSTSPEVHRIAAELMDYGLDAARIHRLVYDTSSENRLRFLGYCLNECLHVIPEYHAAYFLIPQKVLKQFKTQTGDTEGLVNYALSVTGVNLAVTLIEYPDEIRISLRSVGEISVAKIANAHFNGGGHKNAAGGRVQISLADAEQRLLTVIREMGASAFNHKD